MKKYLTGMKRKAERDGDNETDDSLPKAKTRKCDEVRLHCDYGGKRGKTGVFTGAKKVGSGQHEAK